MNAPRVPTREALRSALEGCLSGTGGGPLVPDAEGAFHGDAYFGAALAGPPGRLHGGLHAYARVLSVLRTLRGAEGLARSFPLTLDMRVERPLALDTRHSFEGTYRDEAGGFRLTTRFSGTPKLDATAASAPPLTDSTMAPFRALFERMAGEPARTLMIRGSFPVTAHASGCYLDLDDAFLAIPGNELGSALCPDGNADAVFTCIALDWLGAIGMGVRWQARLYTTRLALQLDVDQLPAGVPLRVVVDGTRPEVHPAEALSPVVLHGEEVMATSLPVALLARDLSRVFAAGRVTLIPVAGQTERLVGPPRNP